MSKDDDKTWKDDKGRTFRQNTGRGPLTTWESHPAYGTAVFHRCQGNPGKLFGSHMENHGSFIGLTISTAERAHDLGRDWIHPDKPVIEVYFSAAQFAQLLTTMNVGEGTPCTIKHLGIGKRVPEIPDDEKVEHERVVDDFKTGLKDLCKGIDSRIKELSKMLDEKSAINKGDRAKIKGLLEMISREVHANMPFQLESFQESVEKTTVAAKAEIDAMLTGAIHAAGIEALREKAKKVSDGLSERAKAISNGAIECASCAFEHERGSLTDCACGLPYCDECYPEHVEHCDEALEAKREENDKAR